MKTLEDLYCSERGCTPDKFRRTLFSKGLPWHAWLAAPFLGGYGSPVFSADRELISAVGLAYTMDDVREDIRDYFMNPANRKWTRRILHLRISTTRLKAYVRPLLPGLTKDSRIPW